MAREADTFTPGEVARALGLTEFTVLSLLTSGQLEGHQDDQARWWIPASAVDAAIMRRSASTDAPPDPSVEETVAMPPISPTGGADTPATDTPATETPATETPATETPATDTPATDTPAGEETIQFEAVDGPVQRTSPTDDDGQATSESGWTTTDQAARSLGVSPRTVRRFIDRGQLEGRKVTEGIVETWEVSIDSLYALRDKRISEGQVRRNVPRKSVESQGAADTTDYIRDLTDRLLRISAEAAELRTRLELTFKTESTLQEERDRLRQDWERERQERQEAQQEAQRLREELVAERSKGFWQRLFGG
jgi:predicted transcriptional regulator